MRVQLLNEPSDISWVKDVHIGRIKPHFKSFVIYGSEDYPGRIECYAKVSPTITDRPVAIFDFMAGD